jgi:hypothetical protein
MNAKQKVVTVAICLMVMASLSLSSCGPGQLFGPTFTPTPTTPPYALKCDIGTEQYSIAIEGETGEVITESNNESTKFGYAASGQRETITVGLNRTVSYKETGHTYKITGQIAVNIIQNTVTYEITATGGGFGDNEQGCTNP